MWCYLHEISSLKWLTWIAAGAIAGLGVMLIRRLVAGRMCQSQASLTGKTVLVTGASSGIGKSTALELAKRDARVIMACRDMYKAKKAMEDIRRQTRYGQLIVLKLDLASLQSVRDFAARVCQEEYLHILINNAGVYGCPYTLTEDGLEMQMAVNHFGHFLLVHLLLDKLRASVCHLTCVQFVCKSDNHQLNHSHCLPSTNPNTCFGKCKHLFCQFMQRLWEIRSTNYHSYSFLRYSGDSGYRNMVFLMLFRCCRMI